MTSPPHSGRHGFSGTELLVVIAVLAVLAAIVVPLVRGKKSTARLHQCLANLKQVNGAVLMYAADHNQTVPQYAKAPIPGGWWWYREMVKGYLGLTGPASASDKVFACPDDRGYGDAGEKAVPFRRSAKHKFTSYVLNGVDLPGMPHVAGRTLPSIKEPARTLLVMEWTAHAPLSWHRSRTGRENSPFYNNAKSVVTFVDGHAAMVPIYYDGINAAYTRDPVPGYLYKYGGD